MGQATVMIGVWFIVSEVTAEKSLGDKGIGGTHGK
jgi:hypothetical protein